MYIRMQPPKKPLETHSCSRNELKINHFMKKKKKEKKIEGDLSRSFSSLAPGTHLDLTSPCKSLLTEYPTKWLFTVTNTPWHTTWTIIFSAETHLSSLCFFGGRNWSTKASHHFHHTTYINQFSTSVEGIFNPALKLPALFLTWQFFNQFLPILPKF